MKILKLIFKKFKREHQTKDAFIVSRIVFDKDQEEETLDVQIAKQKQYCKDKGLNVIRVYKFWGLSDKNDSRNFTKMIKDIKRRKKNNSNCM